MDLTIRPAPYRIETPRLVLRCPEVADIPAIHEGLLESLDSLRPWMPWVATEPLGMEERTRVVRGLRAGFDRNEDFTFMAFDVTTGDFRGGMGLHPAWAPAGWSSATGSGPPPRGRGSRSRPPAPFFARRSST